MSRVRATPDPAKTLWVASDTHLGSVYTTQQRLDEITEDLNEAPGLPESVLHVHHTGDVQDGNGAVNSQAEADAFVAWWNGLRYIAEGAPYSIGIGNHDNQTWTAVEWAESLAAINQPTAHFTMPVGTWGRIIVPYTDDHTILDQTEMDWIEAQLVAHSTERCIIAPHAGLYNTFVSPDVNAFNTNEATFYVRRNVADADSSAMEDLLDAHDNAVCYIHGHNHPEIRSKAYPATGIALEKSVGSRTIVHVTATALEHNGGVETTISYDDVVSTFLELEEDSIKVRWRNHSARAWDSPDEFNGKTVVELAWS